MLKKSGANINEVTWWESPGQRAGGGGATGGGVSSVFPRPAWQKVKVKSLNTGSIDGRVAPDIAALSGPPLYDLIFLGKDAPNGGTSASAPLWAALIARINAGPPHRQAATIFDPAAVPEWSNGQPVGESSSRDITVGNNASNPEPGKGYKAGSGFDAVTAGAFRMG